MSFDINCIKWHIFDDIWNGYPIDGTSNVVFVDLIAYAIGAICIDVCDKQSVAAIVSKYNIHLIIKVYSDIKMPYKITHKWTTCWLVSSIDEPIIATINSVISSVIEGANAAVIMTDYSIYNWLLNGIL